jgi:serine O-acetyltransferase
MFDHVRADLRAHGGRWGAQGFWALTIYRFGRWRIGLRRGPFRKILYPIYLLLQKGVEVVAGIEMPCEVEIGRNFVIDHSGGIVISGYAKFGNDCRIRSGCVVGLARIDDPCAPIVGDNVDIGAGAKLLGRIRIGNNVRIGANAVVVCDVPDDCVAVGVPAVVKPRRPQRSDANAV